MIEVSSYQLEDSTYFHPQYACLLNVTPDHLDHHGGMKNYIKAKAKVFKNQRTADVLVVNGADTVCVELVEKAKSKVLAFSTHPKHLLKTDVFFDGDELIFSEGHQIRPGVLYFRVGLAVLKFRPAARSWLFFRLCLLPQRHAPPWA